MLLGACADKPVKIVTNEVPMSLTEPTKEPPAPNVDTGDDTRDFKNATAYVEKLKAALRSNIDKLNSIRKLLTPQKQ